MTDQITVPRKTWDAMRGALEKPAYTHALALQNISDALELVMRWIDDYCDTGPETGFEAIEAKVNEAITAANAVSVTSECSKVTSEYSEQPQAPYSNCRFRICDLPGQCKGEGKCHHPAVPVAANAVQPEPPSDENIADAWISASDSDGIAYDGPSFERGYRLGRGEYDEYTGALVAAARAEQPQARCEHCDGTGDVHKPTGEWQGACTCEPVQSAVFTAVQDSPVGKCGVLSKSGDLNMQGDMPDCWVVIKDGQIIGTHDAPGHLEGIWAVRYVPAPENNTKSTNQD